MNRKQLYNEIASLGLQGEVKARYGKNYTNCTTAQLQTIVDEAHKALDSVREPNRVRAGFSKLIDILAKKKILLKSEVDAIMNA